jgi:hypothetical protein
LEKLAQKFNQIASLSLDEVNASDALEIVRECKVLLECNAIDLDVDSAFELAQIQRQLSRWHIYWLETWTTDSSGIEISTVTQLWANRVREIAGVLV